MDDLENKIKQVEDLPNKQIKEKVFKVLDFLNNSSYIDEVFHINVEDNLQGFAGGRTSQQVIVKLAKFNAVLHINIPFIPISSCSFFTPFFSIIHFFYLHFN